MALSKSEILNEIENMTIYNRDYYIIIDLLTSVSNEQFTRILEAVIEGDLYWSDFEEILATTGYPSLLANNLEQQANLENILSKQISYRKSLDPNFEFSNEDSHLAIVKKYNATNAEKNEEFYTQEYKSVQDNILYELTKYKQGDNELAIACKIRLYNAIKNGDVIIKNGADNYTYNDNNSAVVDDDNNYYEYINKDDIMLFMDKYIIPLDYEHQTLNDFDRLYMNENNLSEGEMKQFKSLSIILRRDKYFGGD